MTESILDQKIVHVINKQWKPISKTTVRKAINKTLNGRYQIVGEHWSLFDFSGWIDHWNDAKRVAKFAENVQMIKIGNMRIAVPLLVKCTDYNGGFDVSDKPVQFTRRNIFLRDNNTCQYCGKNLPSDQLNLDHIIPKSRGGLTNWENIVLSCVRCNQKKANRTPREANLKLRSQPYHPTRRDLGILHDNTLSKKDPWEVIMDLMYWNTELNSD